MPPEARGEGAAQGFQRAEYLFAHGMLDMVVRRSELNERIGRILRLLTEAGSPVLTATASDDDVTDADDVEDGAVPMIEDKSANPEK